MSVNKYQPHVFVIPEDDASRQIADGFVLYAGVQTRRIQIVEPPGGWPNVLGTFKSEYVPTLRKNQNSNVILLIDFDNAISDRRAAFDAEITEEFADRVFVVGPRTDPETLKRSIPPHSLEEIGGLLASECDRGEFQTWNHDQLKHNEKERERLVKQIKPFLFQS